MSKPFNSNQPKILFRPQRAALANHVLIFLDLISAKLGTLPALLSIGCQPLIPLVPSLSLPTVSLARFLLPLLVIIYQLPLLFSFRAAGRLPVPLQVTPILPSFDLSFYPRFVLARSECSGLPRIYPKIFWSNRSKPFLLPAL